MLSRGFFLGGGNPTGGGNNSGSDSVYEKDGNVYFQREVDSIFVDDEQNVFLSHENKNALIVEKDGKLYARVVN